MRGTAGEVLGLQRKAAVFLHRHAALAGGGAVLQEIAGVELHAGLGGIDLHADAGLIAGSPGAQALAGPAAPVDDKAVVIAAAHHGGLGKAGVDVPANGLARPEIHRRACHGQDIAGGAGLVVALQIAGRIEAQLLVQHVPAAVEVEIGVVRQVDEGIRDMAARYFLILYAPMLFRTANIIFGTVFRSVGDTKTPMRVGVVMNIINTVLNFLFIYPTRVAVIAGISITLPGAGFGIEGAALASAIAYTYGGIAITVKLWKHADISPKGQSF